MSPFAQGTMASALRRIDKALAKLETHVDGGPKSLIGEACAELLKTRCQLLAVMDLEAMAEELAETANERPTVLRLVGQ